ncbi:MAG: hypothetical protein JO142_15540, partial [Burkholderiales bacterium]|nr:hypothetical protein [Burkholderiales bacterium]
MSAAATSASAPRSFTFQRLLLWVALAVFAVYFLTPLYVMVSTSLKD